MEKKNSPLEIQEYYRKRASTNKYATSPDFNLREVEIEFLQKSLEDHKKILDVGCGNGYSTLMFASRVNSCFHGIDFVPEMIDNANHLAKEFSLVGKVEFQVGNALNLDFANSSFDIVVSQRCLLNLPNREDQWTAMKEISRVLKTGGTYLMLEGTIQGLKKLNEWREKFGLEPIQDVNPEYNWFSNKFDEEEMLKIAEKYFSTLIGVQRFGMYYFISRIIHPLMVFPELPKYDAPQNSVARKIAAKIPNFEDIGHVALFQFQK